MNWFNPMRNILKGLRLFKCTCRLYLDLSNICYWSISNWLIMMQYDTISNVFRLIINTFNTPCIHGYYNIIVFVH